jgi:peptide deformylase
MPTPGKEKRTSSKARKTSILKEGHPALREISQEIPLTSIGNANIKKLFEAMAQAIASRDDAVAIAAPQLGFPLRAFMVSSKVFDDERMPESAKDVSGKHFVFINPVITKMSKRREKLEEGCLSVDGTYGMVKRPQKATVRAYDEHGKKFEWGGCGLLAQIFEHEMDHLNGVLFIDKAETTYPAPHALPTLAP